MAKVTLGGVDYELRPLPLRPARELRKRLQGEVENIGQSLQALEGVEVSHLDDLGELISALGGRIAGSVDMIAEWLFDFSPELQADRERIEAEAYDEEILRAFGEALKMLYPFGGMLSGMNGLMAQATLTNSRSRSGGSGRTKSTR